MKAQDLRIGNLVMTDVEKDSAFDGLNFVVGWSEIRDSEILGDNWGYKPIPLTEEWLERFGFEKPAHSWCGDKFHLSNWDKYPDCWCVALNKNNAILVDKLKHVHQLQNLYYALTNSELTLND